MLKNFFTLIMAGSALLFAILGCGSKSDTTSAPVNSGATNKATGSPAATEKPVEIQARALTKEYDDNELNADEKYKGKLLAVSGKISNIAETLGNVTVQLEGHNIVLGVMCSFAEDEKANVARLKKGQQVTLIGTGDGKTLGMYVGLQNCRIR